MQRLLKMQDTSDWGKIQAVRYFLRECIEMTIIGDNWVRSLNGAKIYDATLFFALHARSRLCIRLQELLRKHTTVLSLMQVSTNIKAVMVVLLPVILLVTLYRLYS